MTCIGNSGPLEPPVAEAIEKVRLYFKMSLTKNNSKMENMCLQFCE